MIKLNELDLCDDEYFDMEEEALEALPLNEVGLSELLEYLDDRDSYAGYAYLFREFYYLIDEFTFEKMKKKAIDLFDEQGREGWF